jgi:hypothetical protein
VFQSKIKQRSFIIGTGAAALLALGLSAPGATAAANPDALAPSVVGKACGSGVTAAATLPAAGFNPLTATDQQLLANNLPTRPTDPAELRVWTKFVSTVKPQVSCSFTWGHQGSSAQVISPDASNDCAPDTGCFSANWAGNVATDENYGEAYGAWTLPAAGGTGGKNASSSSWVGIGQGLSDSQPLIQAGSESDIDGGSTPNYYLFVEEYPEQSQVVVSDPGIKPGNTIWVHIAFTHDSAAMTIMDETTGLDKTYTDSGSISTDDTAEWIYERTEEGDLPPLTPAAPSFRQAQAGLYNSSITGVGNLTHYWYTMWNCKSDSDTELAKPGGITNNGTEFSATWLNTGSAGPAGCQPWT